MPQMPVLGALTKASTALLVWILPLCPAVSEPDLPVISIVIDDMGYHSDQGAAAISLPGALTYAFLPHTPYARRLAERAHTEGKEVMLHLPMDSHEQVPLGPGALNLHMTEREFKRTLVENIQAIPHVVGLNNHMGSLLTRHPGAMGWLMQVLGEQNLYFIDSRTSKETVAQMLAQEYGIPNTRRHVFLDNVREPDAIQAQFRKLVSMARKQGYAVGIGHPYPATIDALRSELAGVGALGVRLITVSEMIDLQRRNPSWQELSSPSPKVAKNSKP